MPTDTTIRPEPSPLPLSHEYAGEGSAIERGSAAAATLTLLREWQSVVDAVAAGTCHVLIRKGGIAEGRGGFGLKASFFGLLPTLFHQVKNVDPDAETPEPPRVVSVLCQLVDAYAVPSTTDLSPLSPFHAYTVEQLAARQTYKPERPLHLIVVRPFKLRSPLTLAEGAVPASCRSWADVPLDAPLGGIEPVGDGTPETIRQTIGRLPNATRITP